jgi:hypothetical protein
LILNFKSHLKKKFFFVKFLNFGLKENLRF